MSAYFLRRLAYTLPIAPGDPLNAIAPADAPAVMVAALNTRYRLDKPSPVQFGL
jgi:peptide/nickel transport system permease protein